jgi:hypothetical protein
LVKNSPNLVTLLSTLLASKLTLLYHPIFAEKQSDLDTLSGVISVGSTVKVVIDHRPVREDEVAVTRGDLVLVLEVSSARGYRIRKQQVPIL